MRLLFSLEAKNSHVFLRVCKAMVCDFHDLDLFMSQPVSRPRSSHVLDLCYAPCFCLPGPGSCLAPDLFMPQIFSRPGSFSRPRSFHDLELFTTQIFSRPGSFHDLYFVMPQLFSRPGYTLYICINLYVYEPL